VDVAGLHKQVKMIIIQQPSALQSQLDKYRAKGLSIAFVPTMGALHQGHTSLVNEGRQTCDITVCSIFVNPTQFNDRSDYARYPNRLPQDIRQLENTGADVLFLPHVEDIYPAGTSKLEKYDLGYLETVLEGEYRPGHFQGVCQVMSRLLSIVNPDELFMGKKDYQQCMVIKKLIGIMQLHTTLVACETKRESDGLAMSSRNLRLDPAQRETAPHLYKALLLVENRVKPGDLHGPKDEAASYLRQHGFKVDYLEIANDSDLRILSSWDGQPNIIALAAAYLGDVRLIDNLAISQR
jgi:pantoate--beta-alanine ligase